LTHEPVSAECTEPICDPERKGHIRPEGREAELGYMFLPEASGRGYPTEACAAALDSVTPSG
jgi:RimJ/RimL family protein N-acetyltransferase